MHYVYAYHVLVTLVAVTYVDFPSFCANIAFVTLSRKTDKSRIHTEGKGRRKAKGTLFLGYL